MSMMHETKLKPEVYELHLIMLKGIISMCQFPSYIFLVKSIQGLEDKKDLAYLYKARHQDEVEMADLDILASQANERELTQNILRTFSTEISTALNAFCQKNLNDLKKNLAFKSHRKHQIHPKKPGQHEVKN
jgi:hypothetical protein